MLGYQHVGEFYGRESVKLSVTNGHGEVPSKVNCDCFKVELMYLIDRLWIYCVGCQKSMRYDSFSRGVLSLPRAYLLFNAYREFKSGTSGCFFTSVMHILFITKGTNV